MTTATPPANITVRKDSPLCGDVIDLTVGVADGRIARASYRARACSLVKASAALLEEAVRGRTLDEARALAARIDRAMHGLDTLPDGYERLSGALLLPSRRGCVLLPWRALVDGIDSA